MLELEAFQLKKAKPEIAVQYDIIQTDYKDDHLFCSRQRRLDSGLADLETELAGTHGTFWQTRQNTLSSDSHAREAV
jgi:hypothetical protein